jgi:hypothetical protein
VWELRVHAGRDPLTGRYRQTILATTRFALLDIFLLISSLNH